MNSMTKQLLNKIHFDKIEHIFKSSKLVLIVASAKKSKKEQPAPVSAGALKSPAPACTKVHPVSNTGGPAGRWWGTKIAKNSICRLLLNHKRDHLFQGPVCIMWTARPDTLENLNLEVYGGFLNGSFLSFPEIQILMQAEASKPFQKLRSMQQKIVLRPFGALSFMVT